MRRYLIVGMGAAGIAAAQAIRSRDPHAKIVLVSEERDGYYSRPGLAYYLTGELPEKLLHPFTGADFRRESLRRIHARAAQVSPKEHIVTLEDGQRVSYDRLLIAVGASAFRPPIPGGDLNGVVKLDTLDDAREIIKIARWGRAAVVVGGGITALEIVEGLHTRGARTHYFLRRDRYWGNVLDETESRIVEHRLREEGVRIHYRTELEKIMGKRGRVVGVWTKDGRQIKCRIVAIAIGVRPRLELAKSAGLRCERGILVNKFMESSAADIFAAGDVAQVFDPLTGAHAIDSLWWVARNQGRAAGLNMTGMQIPYRKQVPFNVTRLAGLTTTIIGTVGRGVDKDLVGIAR
ncbi:MAG: NAD(P)/FAD-dependent oxidoreductase, partial [Anaerolineales bacterium]